MKRVLFVVHFPVFGGPHNEALRRERALRELGWETTVVLPDEPGNAFERLRDGGVDVLRAPLHRLRSSPDPRLQLGAARAFPGEVAALRRLIREQGADLVEVGGLVNPHAAVAARREGVPVVWKILDSRPPPALRKAVMPLVRRLADVVMLDGEALLRLHAGRRALAQPTFVYYPPVDTDAFRPSPERRAEVRSQLGIPTEAPVVGSVANVNPQKGLEWLARAAGLVARSRPDCWFLSVGAHYETHGAYLDSIRREIRLAGIPPERFLLVGERVDVERWYPALDVKLITSVPRSEGTTTTAMEAMACGVPVVATDVGAVSEVVRDGETGLVVPPLDAEALAAAVLRLLGDDGLRRRLGEAARAAAETRFSAEAYAAVHAEAFAAALARGRVRRASRFAGPATGAGAEDGLRALLACPTCHGRLDWAAEAARCLECDSSYPVVDDVPVLLPAGETPSEHKRRQAAYFAEVDPEWEVGRPRSAPALYSWLLGEKLERSVSALADVLPGATALTVCGGSGMDAEFLARAGARVLSSDLSLEAARRTQERARRHGVAITPIVADVERLPFRDRAVELVYVHDGLHHLEEPSAGLAEMARVASRAVSVNEPARARATQLAVRVRLAFEEEEAGNRIERLRPGDVAAELERRGFRIRLVERYGMLYRHEPGGVARALSHGGVLALARGGLTALNRIAGRLGNKLTVQAVREPD